MNIMPEIIFLVAMIVIDGVAIACSMRSFYSHEGEEEWKEQETQLEREELDL